MISPWPRIWLLYGCGLLGAAQLGRLSALAPTIRDALSLPLTTVAIAISVIEVGGAVLGFGAGRIAYRIDLRRTLRGALALLTVGAFGGSLAQGAAGLIGWRVLEAAGYLGIIVTAPVLVAQLGAGAGPRAQALALTLWSTFFPVGFGVGALVAAALASSTDWRIATALHGAAALVMCIAVSAIAWTTREPRDVHEPIAITRRAVLLAAAFGAFTFFEVGGIALLPTLLTTETAMSAANAGRWTALASASAVLGSALAAWLLARQRDVLVALVLSLALPALLLFGLFRSAPSTDVAVALALAINTLGGIFIGLAFASLPRVATTHAQIVGANGLIAQCGAAGSLLGPPVMAACIQHAGWTTAAVAGMVASAVSLACMTSAVRTTDRRTRLTP